MGRCNDRTFLSLLISDNQLRGGIRGIVELEVLRQLECAMGGRLAIQCFFDLIVGTRSVLRCHTLYENLCEY